VTAGASSTRGEEVPPADARIRGEERCIAGAGGTTERWSYLFFLLVAGYIERELSVYSKRAKIFCIVSVTSNL
jgi:hypothetical protein